MRSPSERGNESHQEGENSRSSPIHSRLSGVYRADTEMPELSVTDGSVFLRLPAQLIFIARKNIIIVIVI